MLPVLAAMLLMAPDYDTALREARSALERGEPAASLEALDRALRADAEGVDAFLLLGRTYIVLARHDNAAAAFRRAAELAEAYSGPAAAIDALYGMADALARGERNEEAIEALEKVLRIDPDRPAVHHDMGRIHLALGRLEAAAAEFRREIALGDSRTDPARAPSRALGSSYEGLGVASYRLGNDDTAVAMLAKAPATAESRYHLGLSLSRLGRHEAAAAAFREALARDPDHRGALQGIARNAGVLGRDEERKEALARFQDHYRREEEDKARRVSVRDLRQTAERRALEGDLRGAVTALEEASALAPDDIDLLLDLARGQHDFGDGTAARVTLERVLAQSPLNAEGLYRLGRLAAESGDLAEAISLMERASRLAPTAPSYHVHLAQIYMRTGRPDDAVRELRLTRRLDPDDPDGAFNLGLGLAQSGDLAAAAAELETAVSLGYRRPEVHQVLGRLYEALGDPERSRRALETFERVNRERSGPR